MPDCLPPNQPTRNVPRHSEQDNSVQTPPSRSLNLSNREPGQVCKEKKTIKYN